MKVSLLISASDCANKLLMGGIFLMIGPASRMSVCTGLTEAIFLFGVLAGSQAEITFS
jgi:hypothetical protein